MNRISRLVLSVALLILAVATGCASLTPTQAPSSALATSAPTTAPQATLTQTRTVEPTLKPPPSPTPDLTPTPATNPYGQEYSIPSPDGRWTALLDTKVGSLDLRRADGTTFPIFAAGSTAQSVTWPPDSRRLLVVRTNWLPPDPQRGVLASDAIQIWQVRLTADQPGLPAFIFAPQFQSTAQGPLGASQIDWGAWSPNSRYVVFWLGPLSASIQADGVPLSVLDVETGKVRQLDITLLNPSYQSWSPDSSALALTAGSYRSAQVGKWLNIFNTETGGLTTVVTDTEMIPGIVAWSPRGDLVAYAAVLRSDSDRGEADYMGFDNPAISKRRVYLLNPRTGKHWPLNEAGAFQDAPAWSQDGAILYYVQRDGSDMVLMAANSATGAAKVVEGTRRPAPRAVGYYGQSDWDDLLAYRPDAPRAPVSALTQTYYNVAYGLTLRYPAGWAAGMGWETLLYACQDCPTLAASSRDLGPFSGNAFIALQVLETPSDLGAAIRSAVTTPGPGQYVGFAAPLTTFDERRLTVGGRPGARMETMDESGTINHMLVVLDGNRAQILRAQGDARVFDAIAATIKLQ